MALRNARSFSCGSRFGSSRSTSRCADSLRTPVGSPAASRAISPPSGSFVARVISASRSAAELAQPVWRSYEPRSAGLSGTSASSWSRVGMPFGKAP